MCDNIEDVRKTLEKLSEFDISTILYTMFSKVSTIEKQGGATIKDLQELSSMCIGYIVKTQEDIDLCGDMSFLIELFTEIKRIQDEKLGIDTLKEILSKKSKG